MENLQIKWGGKVHVGWGKSKNANRVDAFIWHLRVNYVLEACRIFGNFCLVGQSTLQILIIFELDISFYFESNTSPQQHFLSPLKCFRFQGITYKSM